MQASDPNAGADLARHFHDDGLLDIYLGVVALFAGALITTDLAWMAGILVVALLPSWVAAKRRWIVPRLTPADLAAVDPAAGSTARARLRLALTGTLLVGVGGLALLAWGALSLQTLSPLLVGATFALLVGATLAMIGGTLRLPRFYGYALLPVAGVGAAALGLRLPWAIALGGAVVLAVGIGLLLRFLHRRPAP